MRTAYEVAMATHLAREHAGGAQDWRQYALELEGIVMHALQEAEDYQDGDGDSDE
jgi:hypothetical protein